MDAVGRDPQSYLSYSWAYRGFSHEIILTGNRHPSVGSIQATTGPVSQLPDALRRKIGFENAYHVYRLAG
ncbi:MAG: hypothetical protein QGH33_10970 [Pirellulaceae bacterium]|nr:hypothetical protein [Pirellulaceae bacterium]HJN12119.1 hypothetical protein [Pirellulaceae bacterium]